MTAIFWHQLQSLRENSTGLQKETSQCWKQSAVILKGTKFDSKHVWSLGLQPPIGRWHLSLSCAMHVTCLTEPIKWVRCIAHDRTHVILLLVVGAKLFPSKSMHEKCKTGCRITFINSSKRRGASSSTRLKSPCKVDSCKAADSRVNWAWINNSVWIEKKVKTRISI